MHFLSLDESLGLHGRFISKRVGLPLLGRVRPGSIWEGGVSRSQLALPCRDFDVDFSKSGWTVMALAHSDISVLFATDDWAIPPSSADNLVICFLLPGGRRLFIPCIEFFTRCFARTAEVNRVLCTYPWDEVQSRLYRPFTDAAIPGMWQVKLNSTTYNDDSVFLAHLWHDPFAQLAAKSVYSHINTAYKDPGKPVQLRATPWFEGDARLRVEGVQIGDSFHKFIATLLYVEFRASGAGAEQIFEEFQSLMRGLDEGKLSSLFATSAHPGNSPIITQVREFAQFRSADIKEELDALAGTATGKWVLDVTSSSLNGLLAHWGTKYDVITAVCDNSKPLREAGDFFNGMIGNEKRLYGGFGGDRYPLTFNLSGPLDFRDSKTCHGIQLADALAGAAVHVWSGNTDEHVKKWRAVLTPIANQPILPDTDEVNLRRRETQRNAFILQTLHHRAAQGKPLLEGMPELFFLISRRLALPINRYGSE